MNAIVIVCVRLESRRFPGKALRLLAGKPALAHLLDRIKPAGLPVVLALPEHTRFELPGDSLTGVATYRGEDESPLHRMAAVMRKYPAADWCVRVTHDDVLVDAQTTRDLLEAASKANAGYAVTPSIVEGAGVEVIHRDNLMAAAEKRSEPTEFVSYFVRGKGTPRPGIVRLKPRSAIARPYRLTIDYAEDAAVLEAVLRAVGRDATLDRIAQYLDENQPLLNINRLPELSVYTCARNAAPYVGTALVSVACLRGSVDLEHIFVDDASTDDTLTKAALFAKGVRFLVNERNLGLASSSNVALGECRGRYVMRLDADDQILGEEFRRQWPKVKSLLAEGAQVVYPAYRTASRESNDPREFHHAGGAIFDKAFLNELRFRDGLRHWDGRELLQRIRACGAQVAYLDEPTWYYRDTPGSMSKTSLSEREKIKKEMGL